MLLGLRCGTAEANVQQQHQQQWWWQQCSHLVAVSCLAALRASYAFKLQVNLAVTFRGAMCEIEHITSCISNSRWGGCAPPTLSSSNLSISLTSS